MRPERLRLDRALRLIEVACELDYARSAARRVASGADDLSSLADRTDDP
jgi:hypothetical protein